MMSLSMSEIREIDKRVMEIAKERLPRIQLQDGATRKQYRPMPPEELSKLYEGCEVRDMEGRVVGEVVAAKIEDGKLLAEVSVQLPLERLLGSVTGVVGSVTQLPTDDCPACLQDDSGSPKFEVRDYQLLPGMPYPKCQEEIVHSKEWDREAEMNRLLASAARKSLQVYLAQEDESDLPLIVEKP